MIHGVGWGIVGSIAARIWWNTATVHAERVGLSIQRYWRVRTGALRVRAAAQSVAPRHGQMRSGKHVLLRISWWSSPGPASESALGPASESEAGSRS